MEPHGDGKLPEGLDGLVQRDAAPLDLDPVLGQKGREIRLAHGPEEASFVRGLSGLGEVQRLDGPGLLLGLRGQLGGRRILPRLDRLEILQVRRGGVQGELVGQKIVAGIAVRDVADTTAACELRHIVHQDDLHRRFMLLRGPGSGYSEI